MIDEGAAASGEACPPSWHVGRQNGVVRIAGAVQTLTNRSEGQTGARSRNTTNSRRTDGIIRPIGFRSRMEVSACAYSGDSGRSPVDGVMSATTPR